MLGSDVRKTRDPYADLPPRRFTAGGLRLEADGQPLQRGVFAGALHRSEHVAGHPGRKPVERRNAEVRR